MTANRRNGPKGAETDTGERVIKARPLPPGSRPPRARSPEAERWLEENREAIEGWREYHREHGLPMPQYRRP